ncbi:hypothetical protein PoB_003294600 [Plakobranchus ocellatus]|uniref:Uncharacterized protein n=1 Tax=Plakobranchus ocellatus TaxID=259542 RepID=A0AAV4ADJ1_9GAST|nr:hypothetical protein PoB_003294600 [Plakobranchus ocellatus]
MCDSIQLSSGNLHPSIMPDNNLITHFYWDNFDLNEETPPGAGTKHSTHVIQEIKEGTMDCPEMDRTKSRRDQSIFHQNSLSHVSSMLRWDPT